MTPAIQVLRKAGVDHAVREYKHDPTSESYGLEAAAALGVDPAMVFKTLLASAEPLGLVVGILPVDRRLDLKSLAQAVGAKRAEMADPKIAEKATGYVVGGISPLGQRKRLPVVLDATALEHATIYVSAGKRGLDVALAPSALQRLLDATVAGIAR